MNAIISLFRPQQWIKNIFCFLPLFFDRHVFDMDYVIPTVFAFFAFCLASSGVYCLNDILDIEADRIHPTKCFRPIANGKISTKQGYLFMALCWAASMFVVFFSGISGGNQEYMFCVIVAYLVMNIAYSLWLKRIAILDVFIIAIGFVLRVLIGGFASGIWISHWLILMTFLLSLFLAFAKRRDDIMIFEETGINTRKNVSNYTLSFLNLVLGVVGSVTMVCYILYTVSPEVTGRFGNDYVYITSLFVFALIIRYLQITVVDSKGGSPTKVLLHDRFLQAVILGWIVSFFIILYL